MDYTVTVIHTDGTRSREKVEAISREHAAYQAGALLRTRKVNVVRVELAGFESDEDDE